MVIVCVGVMRGSESEGVVTKVPGGVAVKVVFEVHVVSRGIIWRLLSGCVGIHLEVVGL